MRTKPNFQIVKSTAYKTLSKHNIDDFPINILKVISYYEDVKVITYSDMAKRHNCSIGDVIEINSSEDGVIHYHGAIKKYLIIYNDLVEPKERIYWTLAHEFGHYLLKHHQESNRSSLTRMKLKDIEYNRFEVEANFFARHLIVPPPLVVKANLNTLDKITSYFGVSYTVARITLSHIKDSREMGFGFNFPDFIKGLYNTFLFKVKHGKTCSKCKTFSYIKGAKFCLICGNKRFFIFKKGDDVNMIYPSIELDEEMRAKQCPRCENEEVSGNYCKVCAEFLFNICTGYDDHNNNDYSGTYWHEHKDGCGTLYLDGNARYCHDCGSTSSFYEEGLLYIWNEKIEEKKELVSTDGNPLTSTDNPFSDIKDEDLPF